MEQRLESYPDNNAISMLFVILALSVSSSPKIFHDLKDRGTDLNPCFRIFEVTGLGWSQHLVTPAHVVFGEILHGRERHVMPNMCKFCQVVG